MLTDEYRYKILKLVEEKPDISQRELAESLGISLGKANYCLKALIAVGILKASNFRNSKNKLAYMYLLTPTGIEEKAKITSRFLKKKLQEYKSLQQEIAELTAEVSVMKQGESELFHSKGITEYKLKSIPVTCLEKTSQ